VRAPGRLGVMYADMTARLRNGPDGEIFEVSVDLSAAVMEVASRAVGK